MKLTLPIALIASIAPSVLSFSPSTPAFTTSHSHSVSSTILEASKNKQKLASRGKWAESRGGVAVADTSADSSVLKGEEGLEYVKLVNGDSSADVYLLGGVVTSYINGGQEYIAVRPDAKMDGSKPISGGLSHCWPQFGPGAIQQHGFARNVDWTVKSSTESTVELELAPSDYTKEMWDKDFLCTFTVSLEDDQLTTKMTVDNKGEESFDFQAALHSYFTVSSLENLKISGSFAGKEFLNKLAGDDGEMQTEDRSEITIGEEYDRIYSGVTDPVLNDSGTGKALSVLNTAGWADTVLWNPYGSEAMGFNNFVCVESAKIDPVALEGGGSWTADMALKPSNLE